jgi:HK97 gp10 family phage protein
MSNVELKILNEKRIISALKNSPNEFAKAIQKAVQQTGGETLGKVKNIITTGTGMWKAPVRTGAMRSNIHISETKPLRVVIETGKQTPYAKYVHDGTSRMRARPFMNITKKYEEKNIQEFFKRTVDSFLKDLANKIK